MRAYACALALAFSVLAGCEGEGAKAISGLEALLRVEGGATYVPGAVPEGEAGPKVSQVQSNNNNIRSGQVGKKIAGTLAPGGQALLLSLEGDKGYWLMPAGVPDALAVDELTFEAKLSFAAALTTGPHRLFLRAVDAAGRVGAPAVLTLTVAPAVPRTLDVALYWDTESDLDLHVELPGNPGVIVWAQNINSYQAPPPPAQPDPAQIAAGAVLDFDSNAQCHIDGLRAEHIFYTQAPPAGTYRARVDAFSLCGQAAAHYRVVVSLDGVELARAEGTLTEEATRMAHDAKAGELAVEFVIP